MPPVRFAREASDEVIDAALWYDGQRGGLSAEFLVDVDSALARLGSRPKAYPRLRDASPELGLRRLLLPRFPYALVYVELDDHVRVIAVAHVRRRPGYWLDRIADDAGEPPA